LRNFSADCAALHAGHDPATGPPVPGGVGSMSSLGSAEQITAGATAALRDGMRERQRREWCDRGGGSSVFQRKVRPRSGLLAPHCTCAVWHPRRCPIPASRGPSGYPPGSHGVALLGIIVPAKTFVARLMIIPILPATRSPRIYSALP
jgi:hypothetical protein